MELFPLEYRLDRFLPVDERRSTSPGGYVVIVPEADDVLQPFRRQPIPRVHFMTGRMEALIDLRNLLAQGYVPVIAPDGNIVCLVQSAAA